MCWSINNLSWHSLQHLDGTEQIKKLIFKTFTFLSFFFFLLLHFYQQVIKYQLHRHIRCPFQSESLSEWRSKNQEHIQTFKLTSDIGGDVASSKTEALKSSNVQVDDKVIYKQKRISVNWNKFKILSGKDNWLIIPFLTSLHLLF